MWYTNQVLVQQWLRVRYKFLYALFVYSKIGLTNFGQNLNKLSAVCSYKNAVWRYAFYQQYSIDILFDHIFSSLKNSKKKVSIKFCFISVPVTIVTDAMEKNKIFAWQIIIVFDMLVPNSTMSPITQTISECTHTLYLLNASIRGWQQAFAIYNK